MPPLSPRQEQLLKFLYVYYQAKRCYPTQRECSTALGLKSSQVTGYLDPLVKKGYVARSGEFVRRGIQLTPIALEKLELLGAAGSHNQLNLPTA